MLYGESWRLSRFWNLRCRCQSRTRGKAAVQADIRLHRDLTQKLLGRVADPGGTRCMAGRGADHNRPENVKQAHPMHILSCSVGQKSPASHFFSLLLYRFCPTCAIITLLMFEIAPLGATRRLDSYETGKRGNSRKECLQDDLQRNGWGAGDRIQCGDRKSVV